MCGIGSVFLEGCIKLRKRRAGANIFRNRVRLESLHGRRLDSPGSRHRRRHRCFCRDPGHFHRLARARHCHVGPVRQCRQSRPIRQIQNQPARRVPQTHLRRLRPREATAPHARSTRRHAGEIRVEGDVPSCRRRQQRDGLIQQPEYVLSRCEQDAHRAREIWQTDLPDARPSPRRPSPPPMRYRFLNHDHRPPEARAVR